MYGVTPIIAVIEANGTTTVSLSLRSKKVYKRHLLFNFFKLRPQDISKISK